MQITILGKSGCGRCTKAKEKAALMGFDFEYIAVDEPGEWWINGAVEALAAAAFAGLDFGHPPIIVIDGAAYQYAAGMKALKERRGNVQH